MRRPRLKPKGKEHFCWAWRKDEKARGVAFQRAKNLEAAERCRCHKAAQAETGRCRYHGGTSKSGPEHHSYKHGFYSRYYHGMLASAGEAQASVEAAASSLEELGIHKVLIAHKLGEINATGPSDEAWQELRRYIADARRARETKDREAQATAINAIFELGDRQSSGAAMREASELINTYSKVADRESRRQERAAAVVSVTAFFGFVEMMTQQVATHVSSSEERAAISKGFNAAIERAGLADLATDGGPEPTRH